VSQVWYVDPTHVVITHGHQDHFADAVAVGKRTRASFVAISELANVLDEQGIEDFTDPNLGGTVEFDWGWVKLVQAFQSVVQHNNEKTVDGTAERVTVGDKSAALR
jgi:L-ascorbate metabolism protein UlaG (beta-lactamase superfamily)